MDRLAHTSIVKGTVNDSSPELRSENVLLEFVFADAVPADAANSLRLLLILFSKAGSLGMFAGSAFNPAGSNIEAISSSAEGSVFRYTLKVEGIEIGAFRVLYNMVLRLARLGLPLRALNVLRTSDGSRHRTVHLEQVAYSRTPAGEFPWVIEDVDKFHKNRVIEVGFERPLTETQTDFIFDGIAVWDDLLQADGFARDLESIGSDDTFTPDEMYLQHPSVLEHGIIWIIADDASYQSIVNFFRRVHVTSVPVISFTVH